MSGLSRVMSSIRYRTDEETTEADIVYTPQGLARQLIAEVPIEEGDVLLDPFAGDDAFFANFPEGHVRDWCEIQRGRDFYRHTERCDWIITNPPFSQVNRILDHTTSLCRKGFAYLLPSFAVTTPRLRRMAHAGFNIHSIIFFDAPKAWDSFQLCWLIMHRGDASNARLLDQPSGRQTTLDVLD